MHRGKGMALVFQARRLIRVWKGYKWLFHSKILLLTIKHKAVFGGQLNWARLFGESRSCKKVQGECLL